MDTLRVGADSNACVLDSSALRATFGSGNNLNDREWVAGTFDKIVTAMISKINIRKEDQGKKKDGLVKVGSVVEYELKLASSSAESNHDSSLIFSQEFNGATLKLRTEPESNSFVVMLSRFGVSDCGGLNGEVGSVVPEASIKHCASSRLYG